MLGNEPDKINSITGSIHRHSVTFNGRIMLEKVGFCPIIFRPMVAKQARLGQHFLVNGNISRKIVSAFLPVEGPILEIGPGRGILTEKIVEQSANPLFAVELDSKLSKKLADIFGENISIIQADILRFNLEEIVSDSRINIISNVPYYISRDFSYWLIKSQRMVRSGVLMMQREFVEKLMARPGEKNYLPVSILFQTLFNADILFRVNPGSFSPPPKVQSTVFKFLPSAGFKLQIGAYKDFLLRSFQNRRKTLANNLAERYPPKTVRKILADIGSAPASRAETISVFRFREIWEKLEAETPFEKSGGL